MTLLLLYIDVGMSPAVSYRRNGTGMMAAAGGGGGWVVAVTWSNEKMRDAEVGEDYEITGFDPQNVREIKGNHGWSMDPERISPMGYFCREGDLPMVRWLYVNGADPRDENVGLHFAMYLAAVHGRIEVCKWLCDHGAARDVKRRTVSPIGTDRPLLVTFDRPEFRNVSRWLILRGAMCKDFQSGELDIDVIKMDLRGDMYFYHQADLRKRIEERKLLLDWANDLHQARTSFLLFLSGTLSPPNHAGSTRRSLSPLDLRNLSGQAGILQSIGDYVGIVRGREARIIRQLTELLPDLNKELDAAA